MSSKRRDFLKTTAAAALVLSAPRSVLAEPAPLVIPGRNPARWREDVADDLMMEALGAAKDAGASYADVRVGRYRSQNIGTRERQITGVSDTESYGIGIRTIVNGAWGFAATSDMTKEGVVAAAREAARLSRAASGVQRRKIELAPAPVVKGEWKTPIKIDPLNVAIEDKVGMLLAANEAALKLPGIRFVTSGLQLLSEIKMYANSEGSKTTQTFVRVGPSFSATAVGGGGFEQYGEELAPRGEGWEYVQSLDMPGNAAQWAAHAVEKLSAKSVEPGRYDVIIDPQNLWLTIHESIGHPTELDRAMGYEANYAGTSFIAPPEQHIGKLKYGMAHMNVQGDRTQVGSLSRCAWDDEGVAADSWLIVEKGMFKDYQTTREQASWIKGLTGVNRSHGCSFADSWSSVQFQRMPNISLLPGEQNIGMNDIIAATDRGIVIKNRGSWSIDHQRYNFQFSGQAYYEVRGGKITGMLKDVAYQSTTPVFWNSMDMIGGKDSYWLGGAFNDGKGQPGQSNSVSHGCPPARFRNVNIVNTGRQG
jgi:TldD protein